MILPLSVPARVVAVDMWVMLAVSLAMVVFSFAHLTASRALGLTMTTTFAVYVFSVF